MPYTPHTNATTQSRQAYLAVKITVARGNFTTDGAEQLLLRLPIHTVRGKTLYLLSHLLDCSPATACNIWLGIILTFEIQSIFVLRA